MIIIKNGERQIYNPKNSNLKLVNPKLILEDNAAGSLSFKIYDSNLNYNTLKKLYPIVAVERNGKIIFKGRVISDKKDFYNGKSVEVEGKLAFFNDSYMEPFEFSGSPKELFMLIVDNHNSQVKEWQKFKVGVVTVEDANDYIVRSSENIINSWDALKEKCFKSSLGGHVRIRYEEDGDYIDWLSDYETVSKQSIEFAKNMIDLSTDVDATETYTAIRPVGAEVEGKRINISSVNDGKNYLVNEEKAEEYGIIYAPDAESTWDDVTLPENLLKKAKEKLFGSFIKLKETYEIKAIDLNLTNDDIEALNICEYVPVISRPHGINGNYLLSKAEIAITEPQNSMFYLGSSKRTLSDMNSGGTTIVAVPKNVSSFKNDAGYISEEKTGKILEEYSKTEEVKKIVNNAVSNVPSGADGASAYEIAIRNGFAGSESEWLESLNGQDGYAPEIGENGNWFINNADTGKPSKGKNGFSPIIAENEGNTDSIYKLDITTAESSFTTPNLKGADGQDGSGDEYVLPLMSSTERGGAKVGYKQNGTKYPVQIEEEKMFVDVPQYVEEMTSGDLNSLCKTDRELKFIYWRSANSTKIINKPIEVTDDAFCISIGGHWHTFQICGATWGSGIKNLWIRSMNPNGANFDWVKLNVWKANTKDSEGYVKKGSGHANMVWKTDEEGVPGWKTDKDTTYENFVKSGSGAKAGLVPAPSTTAGTTKYLREDGTWQVPPDTNTVYMLLFCKLNDATNITLNEAASV